MLFISFSVIRHLLRRQLLLQWFLRQQRVRVRVMIRFLVRGKVTIKIRNRVRVKFNVRVYHWSNCRRSKCLTFSFSYWQRNLNQYHSFLHQVNQGGLRAVVSTSNNEFKQLSVFYGHTQAFRRCSGVFYARCSMPPTSREEMKIDF